MQILTHETGHVLANLGDEYTNAHPGFPNTEEPNTTRQTESALIKWRVWMDSGTPVPTPRDRRLLRRHRIVPGRALSCHRLVSPQV